MDSQRARKFRQRWQAAATIKTVAPEAASLALRWQQSNAILRLARNLGLTLTSTKQEEMVWQRWARLKANRELGPIETKP